MNGLDITGQKFGRLTARTRLPPTSPGKGYRWECDCDCGAKTVVLTRLLTYKNGTKSCGCILREKNRLRPVRNSTNLKHGHTSRLRSPEYICWGTMIQRCTNPKHLSYKHYGARGIEVCKAWLESFEQFFADMGPKPARMTLERKNGNEGYNKDNCRWASYVEQANNRSSNRPVTYMGVTRTCQETMGLLPGISETNIYRWSSQCAGGDILEKVTAHLAWKAKRSASVGS